MHEFHLSNEGNIPSFYASFALLLSALLLTIIAFAKQRVKAPFTQHWFGLAIIFLYLAFDEMIELHESVIRPVRSLLDTSGLLYFAWVIPFSILLIIFLATYLRFILHLPRHTRILFIVAGALFVMGAIGLELLGGRQAEILKTQGSGSGALVTFQTIEELLEMTGVVIFIHALTSYLASELGQLHLRFRSPSIEQ